MITYRQFYDIFQSSRRLWVMGSAENDGTETVEPILRLENGVDYLKMGSVSQNFLKDCAPTH